MRLRLHRLVADEIKEAAEWYLARGDGLERRFLTEVRSALERLEANASQFPALETISVSAAFQRIRLESFPYLIVYEQIEDEVFVFAVAHASRRPNYWRQRKRTKS